MLGGPARRRYSHGFVSLPTQSKSSTYKSNQFGNGTFRGEGEPPDPFYERGCRHPIDIDGQTYIVDALEMPSKHLLSNPMLEQALGITEAAVLVYDVRDPASLRLVEGIAEFMRDSLSTLSPPHTSREYGLMLVGNKSDVDDTDRQVSWAGGSKSASAIRVPSLALSASLGTTVTAAGCPFLEVSAKSGDNIDKIFPQMGREILKLKNLAQQQREQAERVAKQQQMMISSQMSKPGKRKGGGLWRMLSTPFFRRQGQQQQVGEAH